MPRPPEVFVRALTDEENERLLGITRRTREPVKLRRAMIVQMSAQGRSVGDIAELTAFSERYIREVIHNVQRGGIRRAGPKMERGSAEDEQ